MRFRLALAAFAGLVPAAALADSDIGIDRAVFVERQANGVRALEPATTLRRGDKVVLVVEWRAGKPGRRTTVQTAVPQTLAFQRAASDSAEVSIDGGRTWGALGALKAGPRLATAEDVTHVRQRVSGAGEGRLSFSAIVR